MCVCACIRNNQQFILLAVNWFCFVSLLFVPLFLLFIVFVMFFVVVCCCCCLYLTKIPFTFLEAVAGGKKMEGRKCFI